MYKKELSKKSQISIFIILGIILVSVIAFFFIFRNNNSNIPAGKIENFNIDSFKPFVDSCLEEVSKDAVFEISSKGGYYFVPENSLNYFFYNVPLYLDKKEKFVPNREMLEKEMNLYIQDALPNCFDYFLGFELEGYSIGLGEIQINTKIQEENIKVNAKIPLTVKKEENTNLYENFSITLKQIYLLRLLKLSEEIVNKERENPDSICITCLDEKAETYGVEIELIETPINNEFIYSIRDFKSNLTTNETLIFNFGVRYDFPECENAEECFNEMQ